MNMIYTLNEIRKAIETGVITDYDSAYSFLDKISLRDDVALDCFNQDDLPTIELLFDEGTMSISFGYDTEIKKDVMVVNLNEIIYNPFNSWNLN